MSKVREVVTNNFNPDGSLRSGKNSLMLVYAPWCGYCNSFKPVYEQFSSKTNPMVVDILAINADSNPVIMEKFKARPGLIQGYPTVLYFSKGKLAGKYNGPRTEQGLIDFIRSN